MFGEDRATRVGIDGDSFTINDSVTYEGKAFEGRSIEGLLLNSRMIQALFDDENPETRDRWVYPDTGEWDPERNVTEFVEALPTYYEYGLRAVTINLQCGNPIGYSPEHPQIVSAYHEDGSLKDAWLERLQQVLDAADEVGMVIILGLFYQGQDNRLQDEQAVKQGVENVIDWLLANEYTNVLIELNNECNALPSMGWGYDHTILRPGRVSELIELVKSKEKDGFRYLVGTSFTGGRIPEDNVIAVSDFALIHGNGIDDPWRLQEMVTETKQLPCYTEMPIVFNEDDNYDFLSHPNNMLVAIINGASWGYYDAGRNNYHDGFQSPPVDWEINSERKKEFFEYVKWIVHDNPESRT